MTATITLTDAVTGTQNQLEVNPTLSKGQEFRLVGRDLIFEATKTWVGFFGTPMVRGVSKCMRFSTEARVCDTARPLS